MNYVPGVNAIVGLHDIFQVKLYETGWAYSRDIFNVPGMIPATAITYGAILDRYKILNLREK